MTEPRIPLTVYSGQTLMTHDCTDGITDLVGEPFSGVEEHEDHHLVGGHGDDVFPGAAFRYCASTSTNLVTNNTTKRYQATSSYTCCLVSMATVMVYSHQAGTRTGHKWVVRDCVDTVTIHLNQRTTVLPFCLGPGPCSCLGPGSA